MVIDLFAEAGIKSFKRTPPETLRALVGDPRTQLHVKVYLIGLIQSHGYNVRRRQKIHPDGFFEVELAIKLVNGRAVPFMPMHIGSEIVQCTREYYARAGRELSDEEAARAKPTRQHLRRALEVLEDAGYALRATFEKTPRPLRSLPPAERQKVAANQKLLLYFYLTPRPATVLPDVANFGYVDPATDTEIKGLPKDAVKIFRNVSRIAGPIQLCLFAPILDDLRQKHAAIKEARLVLKRCTDDFRDMVLSVVRKAAPPPSPAPPPADAPQPAPVPQSGNLFEVPPPTKKRGAKRPAETGTIPPQEKATPDEPPASSAELFHQTLVRHFAAASLSTPTKGQTRPLYAALGDHAQAFADALTPELLRKRGVKHPGILDSLAEEYLVGVAHQKPAAPAEPQAPVCSSCQNSGLVGVNWATIPDAVAAVQGGAQYCDCPEGAMVRDLVEPAILRTAAHGD